MVDLTPVGKACAILDTLRFYGIINLIEKIRACTLTECSPTPSSIFTR
jgi:hypothetical protein